MSSKKYTVLVIPEGSHRVRRFHLRRSLIPGVVLTVAVFLVAFAFVLHGYLRANADLRQLYRLQAQNVVHQKDLCKLSADIGDLRQQLMVLSQNDAKVRLLAHLAKPKADSLPGTGGPAPEDASENFTSLQNQIDHIRQAIDLRRESQEEVQGFLNDQRSLLAARPTGWPIKGWVTSGFGPRTSPFTGKREFHPGLDIAARIGTPIHSTADGIVSRAGPSIGGYGNLVVIDNGYGFKTYYGHNSKIFVKVGQRVKRGQVISAVGDTGRSTGAHLHYEIRLNDVPINPRKFL
ncbi:MAG TPA: M23 family metallopeptidase [Desulfuromonadales bacterium]|nr:M23 family metallopeptidase [Desulfuromonadales bacterium]